MTHSGSYDPLLVTLSVLVAVVGSFTAFEVVAQARMTRGLAHAAWLGAAAVAAGGAIWSMHFIGMLAFHIGMSVGYDWGITVFSLLVPIAMTGIGLKLATARQPSLHSLVSASLFMGLGVAAMHYIGMSGMRMEAEVTYDRMLVAASIVIAIGASAAALWLLSRERSLMLRLASACAMGFAIAGMHYTAMAAARFVHRTHPPLDQGSALDPSLLAVVIASVTGAILLLAFAAANAAQMRSIRETEHRLATIASNLPGMIYRRVMHPDGRITYPYLSDGVCTLLGVTRAELDSGFSFEEIGSRFMQPSDVAEWENAIRRSASVLSPYMIEGRLKHRDGSTRWVQSAANPYHAADGSIVWDGVMLDITERKRWEEHQRLLVNELNHRVKNSLATAQSIAAQTLRNAETMDEARARSRRGSRRWAVPTTFSPARTGKVPRCGTL